MQRSSSSIGGLAAALAKAQAELVNPEKSLVGSIHPDGPTGVERIFRYAPLSAGLDIVRKTLGQHDIAVVQTTAIDHSAGIVNSHNGLSPRQRRMDRIGLARLRGQRDGGAASDGSSADLCPPLCPLHAGRNRGRG